MHTSIDVTINFMVSQFGRLWLLQILSVCVSDFVSPFSAFMPYISFTVGRILIKLGGNV